MGHVARWADRFVRAVCSGALKHPVLGMFILLGVALALSAAGMVIYPLEIDSSPSTFVPRESEIGRREETRSVIEEVTRFNPFRNTSDLGAVDVPQQGAFGYGASILLSVQKTENIFDPARVDTLRSLETAIRSLNTTEGTHFTDVCLRDRATGDCVNFYSLLPYLYATAVDGCPGVYSPTGAATTRELPLETALQGLVDPSTEGLFCFTTAPNCSSNCLEPSATFPLFATSNTFGYQDNNASLVDTLDLSSHLTLFQVTFGVPLAGYDSIDDRYDEQLAVIKNFVRALNTLVKTDYAGENGIRMTVLSAVTSEDYFDGVVVSDTSLIAASMFVVFLYVAFHLQSLFVASMGLFHVLLSFPIAYFFTQLSIEFGGMGVLNLMSLFIILGIGADDIFIFVDAWKQSEHEVLQDGKHRKNARTKAEEATEENRAWVLDRLVWAYERSSSAMLITSLTTGAAFLMNLASNVPAVQIFGLFTGFMILFNYILVVTYFPFVVIVYQRYIRFLPIPCCCRKKSPDQESTPAESEKKDLEAGTASGKPNQAEGEVNIDGYRRIERFFYGPYSSFIHNHRWLVLGLFAVLFVVCAVFASRLQPSQTPTEWLPSSDPFQIAFNQLNNEIGRVGEAPQIVVMYGIKTVDQSSANKYNPADVGVTRYREDFDPTTTGFQEAFVAICERLRGSDYVHNSELLCPIEHFRDYVTNTLSMSFPVPTGDFVPLLANFTAFYETQNGPAPDVSGSTPTSEQTPTTRTERNQAVAELYQTIRFADHDGEPQLVYLSIVANTTLGIFGTAEELRPVYKYWEDLIAQENSKQENIDTTLIGGLQTTSAYIDLQLEESLLQAATVGILASVAISFFIILVMTRDVWLSTMSIIAIIGVVATLMGFMVMIGWSLSLIESLCLTILVGLSVDYVIHLAHSYQETSSRVRLNKIRQALVVMGISVVSAAITTFLSSFVLFFSYILFFFKFGLFIAFTIFFSALWSFGFFMALAAVIGPRDRHDHFYAIYSLLTGKGWNSTPHKAADGESELIAAAGTELTSPKENSGESNGINGSAQVEDDPRVTTSPIMTIMDL